MDLIKRGKYPFIDIEVDNRKSGQAGNQRLYDYVRHEYNVVVRFCLAYPDKEVVMNGQFPDPEDPEDETPVRKGLWDMAEDIEAAIDSDLSFSGTVKNNAVIPTIMVDSFYYQEGLVWVGRGAMIFSVTKDIAKR